MDKKGALWILFVGPWVHAVKRCEVLQCWMTFCVCSESVCICDSSVYVWSMFWVAVCTMWSSSSSKSFSSSRTASRVCVWKYNCGSHFKIRSLFQHFEFREAYFRYKGVYLFHYWFVFSGYWRRKGGELVSGEEFHPQLFSDFAKK